MVTDNDRAVTQTMNNHAQPTYEVQSKSNAYIFIVTVQELLLQPR